IIHDGTLVYVNQRLAAMTGHSVEEVIGTAFLDYVDPTELPRATEAYGQMMLEDAETQRLDTLLRGQDGQGIDVAINAGVIPYEGGKAALLMIRDVTEEKQWQEALRENERIETIRILARGVAHNFNNIIGVIQGYAVSMADNLLPETRPHEYAKRIADAARHAFHLTERLTSVAEVTEGSLRANVKTVPLREVVADAVDLVEHAFADKGIRVEVSGADGMPNVRADRSQLFDAIMSVMINASEAMPNGGTVMIDHVERRIARPRVNPTADGGFFVGLRIRDSGEGMSRDLIRKVFDPFFTTKEDPSAFGLGLTMARTMLVGMGGWIDVRSRQGRGTLVRFYMPKVVEVGETKNDMAEHREAGTILFADDDETACKDVTRELEKLGYAVLTASNGEEAAALSAEHADDIKLTVIDMIMPGTDGQYALERILKRKPDSRIILTSGFSRDYVRSCFQSGAWAFLQKPYTPQRLVDRIEALLAKKGVPASGSTDG
ncbi:MAG: response regulator, partial [Lentisphaerae bacterium]|nr:response regulator [Lentisphaerota bacterium]